MILTKIFLIDSKIFARKTIRPFSGTFNKDIVALVADEINAINKLCDGSHKNIVKVLQHGLLRKNADIYFIDMEYCDASLEDYVKEGKCRLDGLLDWPNARNGDRIQYLVAGIMEPILCGLIFIHSRNLVHRDVSPQNRNSYIQ